MKSNIIQWLIIVIILHILYVKEGESHSLRKGGGGKVWIEPKEERVGWYTHLKERREGEGGGKGGGRRMLLPGARGD